MMQCIQTLGRKGTVIPLLRNPLCRKIYCVPPGAKAMDEMQLNKDKPWCFKTANEHFGICT